ncbi:hypothetical protein [Selenomonas ruminantium]|uniref:hypothetical protein n=1 Tax=Selenomonas ruminantium TaxID=971 RepID=UPI0015A2ABAE|nr:hypothetical protein [Selenomonas ruminantium]
MYLQLTAEACQYCTGITLGGGGDTFLTPERLPAGLARKQALLEIELNIRAVGLPGAGN